MLAAQQPAAPEYRKEGGRHVPNVSVQSSQSMSLRFGAKLTSQPERIRLWRCLVVRRGRTGSSTSASTGEGTFGGVESARVGARRGGDAER